MAAYDTKAELLEHLDNLTRKMTPAQMGCFATAKIAEDCHVSRNLASQYLNDLVREGLVVKIDSRPVLFLHRRGIERFLQTRLDRCEFKSMADLLSVVNADEQHDFEKAIGFEINYGTCVDYLKSAIQYPPRGIPALLVGEHGTGKRLMSELSFEYGMNARVLPKEARYVSVNCARDDGFSVEREIFGDPQADTPEARAGAVGRAAGGVVYLSAIDHLSPAARELVLQRICEDDSDQVPRYIMSTSRSLDSEVVKSVRRYVPIVVELPRLSERSLEERTSLTMHFLRVEGRRIGADVSLSRGALRALVGANFDDNIDGLRACITNSCASAFLNREDELLVIRTFNLPASIIGSVDAQPDDDQLVSNQKNSSNPSARVIAFLRQMGEPLQSYEEQRISFGELLSNAISAVRGFSDYMNFENQGVNARMESYEQVVWPIMEEIEANYGIELSRKVSRLVAQLLFTQLWGSAPLAKWRQQNREKTRRMLDVLARNMPGASVITEQASAKVRTALGVGLDELSTLVLFVEVCDVVRSSSDPRDYLGIIMCHGYSTATSMADAANRILRQRVFEAIDMTYDQEVSDVAGRLQRILENFSHCTSVAILVDMGSLETVSDAVSPSLNCDVHIANNVSTGLALEVGSALLSHDDLTEVFSRGVQACAPHYRVVRRERREEAVVFCSEAGVDTAGRLRKLVLDSIPGDTSVRLVTCDYVELAHNGAQSHIFEKYCVNAIVGTMDPGIVDVAFVGLEDLLYRGASEALDLALFRSARPEVIAEFHSNLVRGLTLKNVIESITILNPEMLYAETDQAVERLSKLTGMRIDPRRRIALYMHLFGLIERLMTNNFVETYPDVESFERDNAGFIVAFREAFAGISRRYRVEVPVSEIGYVHHMVSKGVETGDKTPDVIGVLLEDE